MNNKKRTKRLNKIRLSIGLVMGIAVLSIGWIIFNSFEQTVKAADPFGGSPNKRLSVYDGRLVIQGTAGLYLGNAGRDIQSTGRIYLRPDGSSRGSYLEGAADSVGQRLELTGGITGEHTLGAIWAGSNGQNSSLGAMTGHFHGGVNNAVGSAVKGEVTDCGVAKTCYAGYFSGGGQIGLNLIASSTGGGSEAALKAVNNNPNGVAGSFEGLVIADIVTASGNTRGACQWELLGGGDELTCSNGRLLAGVGSSSEPDPTITKLYCCEL